MKGDEEAAGSDRLAEDQRTHDASQSEKGFPTHAVVGVIDDAREALMAVEELRAAGFDAEVLCGESGVERIESAGGSAAAVRVIRMAQTIFGYEAEHTELHTAELAAGHFILLAESHDDESTDRIRDAFSEHGGHFVNYYSRWTSRTLIP